MSYQVSFFKNLLSSDGHLFPAAIRIEVDPGFGTSGLIGAKAASS